MKRIAFVACMMLMFAVSGDRPLHRSPGPDPEPKPFTATSPLPKTWYRFWYMENGRMRMEWSESADIRLAAVWREVIAQAHLQGYRFRPPVLRQTKPGLEQLMPNEKAYILAMTYQGADMTIVNRWWMDRLSDRQLKVLLAHELGHTIDRQNQRMGHPFLELMPESGDSEFVAEAIATHLYGITEVIALDLFIHTYPI